ncbi:MAG: pyrroline-5-carboxylate reductase [Candidatus Woesearchaeota archaeon]
MTKIGFIGAGNMGSALIAAINKAKLAESIIAFDPNEESLIKLERKFSIKKAQSNIDVVKFADIIFLAVKPFLVEEVLNEVSENNNILDKNKLFVSIAAGVKLKTMEDVLPESKIVRVMPNTPCFVGEMAAGFVLGKKCSSEDAKTVKQILDCGGISFEVKEEQLDAVTGLSGSGPAFVVELIQAFTEAGKKVGLSEEISRELSRQTFLGTAKMLKETEIDEEKLKEIVTTKGGTTEAGRKVLEKSDLRKVIIETVKAATQRSKELGVK